MDLSHAAESFRGLVLRHRGRTGLTQRELAARLSVDRSTVQDWETGVKFPTAERLQALIRALLEASGLTPGRESVEAHELWAAAMREAPRMRTPFDEEWFAPLLVVRASPSARLPSQEPMTVRSAQLRTGKATGAQDWGEAPDTVRFVGRAEELVLLQSWLRDERCRLVAVLGFGGIGKTSLAARSAQQEATGFERVYWRSLRNAPPVNEWLAGAIGFLSDREVVPPPSESELIAVLLRVLRASRCLLVLDNSETLFEPGLRAVRYRAGMDGYGRVLQAVGESSHRSCLLLTSREAPPELTRLADSARLLELHGLGTREARALLADTQLIGDSDTWDSLVERYGGNGLALKIVGETISRLYGGKIGAFLQEAIASYGTVFGGIRRLLDVQVERLSPVEYGVLSRFAVEREPISLAELSEDMPPHVSRGAVIEAVETLRQRSLVERGDRGATFTLQSMVLEYVTDRLVQTIADEIERRQAAVLVEQPLMKAQAKDFVRQTQERLIGVSILQQLTPQYGQAGTEVLLLALLDTWRGRPAPEPGYGPGNVVNLLRLLRNNLRGADLSHLSLRQVFLQGVDAQDASLVGTHLTQAVLDEAFPFISVVALSTDGTVLVGGTPTGEVRIWRARDRTPLLAAHAHTGMVWDVALSDDARLAVSGGEDSTLRLWEVETGRLQATLKGHTAGVRGVALAGDGRLVASASWDATVRLWETGSGRVVAVLHGHAGGVRSVALSRDGRLVASGGDDGTVRLWDSQTAELLSTLEGHTGLLWRVALSGDGRLVASAGEDGTLRLWESASGEPLETVQGDPAGVRSMALSADGQVAAGGGWDGTVRVWETRTAQQLATLHGHTGVVVSTSLSGDGRLVASAAFDGAVLLSEVGSGQVQAALRGDSAAIRGVAISADGRLVASGGADGSVRLWKLEGGEQPAILHGHTGVVVGVALSQDGRLAASAGWDRTVRIWHTESGRCLATLRGHDGGLRRVALSGDGRVLACAGDDGTVRLWETETWQLQAALRGHAGHVFGVALSADGQLVASGGVDGIVRLWQAATRQLLATLAGHTGAVWSVALSADGHLLASGGADRTVMVWDVRDGKLLATLKGHTGVIYGVGLNAEGVLVASSGVDETVRLWDPRSEKLIATLRGHAGAVWDVAVAANGLLVASGGDDGLIRVWDARDGACLHALRNERRYQRMDITGLTGVTEAQRAALLALGAVERASAL
jgi:WD40 repeat protein/transcriptional regulator with XRE-family HTH domain